MVRAVQAEYLAHGVSGGERVYCGLSWLLLDNGKICGVESSRVESSAESVVKCRMGISEGSKVW